MSAELFYAVFAEAGKFLLYVLFLFMIGIGLWQRKNHRPDWARWIHSVVILNFIIGGLYSGLRMLTTDPFNDIADS